MPFKLEELITIASDGDWDKLVGEIEGDNFDGKNQPYDLSGDYGKVELAKDVSAFSNAGGGIILIGANTKEDPSSREETITSFSPFLESLFNREQYLAVIREWICPEPKKLQVSWQRVANESDRGLGVIIVPEQPSSLKPFLVSKTILDSGRRREIIFGYVERKLDISDPLGVIELQRLLRSGLQFETELISRLNAIDAAISQATLGASELLKRGQHIAPELVRKRMEATIAISSLAPSMHLLVAASPDPTIDIPDFFNPEKCNVAALLEHPPVLRPAGFDLHTGDTPKVVHGESWRVVGYAVVVSTFRDGMLTVLAGERNLTWGMKRDGRINPKALCESLYSTCSLYARILSLLGGIPKIVALKLAMGSLLRSPGGAPAELVAAELNELVWAELRDEVRMAEAHSFEKSIELPVSDFDPEPGVAAFKLAEEIFSFFGFPTNVIPYTETVDGRRIISPNRLKRRDLF